jgi:hypothetical protein
MIGLSRPRPRRGNAASQKFVLPCQRYADSGDQSWLEITSVLKENQPVLTGVLERNKAVVIKHGTVDKTTNEYEVAKALWQAQVPYVIKYCCMFTCKDSIDSDIQGLCNGKKGPRGFIVMPHYDLGSVEAQPWTRSDFDVLKSVAKQAVSAYLIAHRELGFQHRDFHAGNVLLRKTKKSDVPFGTHTGMIMDFQDSKLGERDTSVVYRDIDKFLRSMVDMDASDVTLSYDAEILRRKISESPSSATRCSWRSWR